MKIPIAAQLYSLREELSKNFDAVVKKIAEIGFIGVETAGFQGTTLKKAAKLFYELKLVVTSVHAPMPIGESKQQTLDMMHSLDSKRIVSVLGPDYFLTEDKIKETCEKFNESSAVAIENGMSFAFHNHWWEFLTLNNRLVYEIMLDYLEPEVLFELDTYWVKYAGLNPAEILKKIAKRAPILHIKDGNCKNEKFMTAVGDGIMDFQSIVKAGNNNIEWMIVELDNCETDMMKAIEKSYSYLTSNKLAYGKI